MMRWLLPPFVGLWLAGSQARAPEPLLGQLRYTLADAQLAERLPGSELFALHSNRAEFVAPLQSLADRDRLALLSHEATGLCGSIDYYPPGYRLADERSHIPPHFSPEYSFTSLDELVKEADLDRMQQTLTTLTGLGTRFHRHATGQNAGTTVKDLWTNEILQPTDWSVSLVAHETTPQKSVVAKLAGSSEETVVLGAHLDSINAIDGSEGDAPGADDDGSGIAILTEILHIIEQKGLRFHKTVELQAYAAEEVGLVGSRSIASSYRQAGRSIAGMMQFDMAYYSQTSDLGKIFFLEDYTSPDLFRNSITLLKRYLKSPYERGVLPRGSASDHKSYWEQGYPTIFPFENPKADNPYIHTANDTMDKFDDGLRMKRMVQLGLLFLSYQAGLVSLDDQAGAEKERLKQADLSKDLFLHLSGKGGSYTFEASAPSQAAYLEYCRIEEAADFRCLGERQKLEAKAPVSGRLVFTGESLFQAGESYRIEAYSAADELIARRHVTLE